MSDSNSHPDPTELTTDQLEKAIANAEKLSEAKLEILRERIGAIDKSIVVGHEALTQRLQAGDDELLAHIRAQKDSVDAALAALMSLLAEKDKAIALADAARKEARDKAESALDAKLHDMNKFREQNALERAHLVSREAHEGDLKQIMLLIERGKADMDAKVPRELYDSALTEWSKWRGEIDGMRREESGKDKGISATARITISVITTIAVILGIVNFFRTTTVIQQAAPRDSSSQVEVVNPPSKPVPIRPTEQ